MSTNPNNTVGTNASFGGRTSVNAFNDVLALFSGRGILAGWKCEPNEGMSVVIGGNSFIRDVALAEDNAGNKTTVNNINGEPVEITIASAPATGSRIDAIVAYVDKPATGTSMDVDNPAAVGLIDVSGEIASSPTAPDDNAIRSAITADGGSGATAYYVILATVTVPAGTTDITSDMISAGVNARLTSDNIDFTTLGLFRGKDLTNIYTLGEISERVRDGSFKDLYIGDYVTKSITHGSVTEDIDFVIAGFDYFLNSGSAELTTHHIVFVPRSCFNTVERMNASSVVTGGYKGSEMYTTNLEKYRTGIINAFGSSHVLSHRRLLTQNTNSSYPSMCGANINGCSTGWAWTDAKVELMNEGMVYGTSVMSSSYYDLADAQMQLPLFALAPNYKIARLGKNGARQWWWLSAVSNASAFCEVSGNGNADSGGAAGSDGVRPYFLFA